MRSLINFISVGLVALFVVSCQQSAKYEYSGIRFDEPGAPQKITPQQDWESIEAAVHVAWGSSNIRYHKEYIPTVL